MTVLMFKLTGENMPALKTADIQVNETDEPGGPQAILVKKGVFTIGRGSDCDVRVTVSSVSRKHCSLIRRDDGWYIKDHRSKSGTFIYRRTDAGIESGVQLISGEFLLKKGDHISLGGPEGAKPILLLSFGGE
ncbi:FHA domain-containing protein [Candidatus Woesearchaeota archaeon]|nr:FHA domain-containing protein [Candidatus Woesearchaeota archaeon]